MPIITLLRANHHRLGVSPGLLRQHNLWCRKHLGYVMLSSSAMFRQWCQLKALPKHVRKAPAESMCTILNLLRSSVSGKKYLCRLCTPRAASVAHGVPCAGAGRALTCPSGCAAVSKRRKASRDLCPTKSADSPAVDSAEQTALLCSWLHPLAAQPLTTRRQAARLRWSILTPAGCCCSQAHVN